MTALACPPISAAQGTSVARPLGISQVQTPATSVARIDCSKSHGSIGYGQHKISQEGRAPNRTPHRNQQGAAFAPAHCRAQGRRSNFVGRPCRRGFRHGARRACNHPRWADRHRASQRRAPQSVPARASDCKTRQIAAGSCLGTQASASCPRTKPPATTFVVEGCALAQNCGAIATRD